jgi:hypothetical protein
MPTTLPRLPNEIVLVPQRAAIGCDNRSFVKRLSDKQTQPAERRDRYIDLPVV